MIWKFFHHWASAISLRASLFMEVQRAKKSGRHIPKGIFKSIWRVPHNQEEYIWLLRFITNKSSVTLIDIGGNSGYWAEAFLEFYPQTTIYAFEPVPEMYEQYKRRFSSNPKIVVFNTALGETNEQKEINIASGYGLTSFNLYSEELGDKNEHFTNRLPVQVSQLNGYTSKIDFKSSSPVIIKVDVQGFETKVIRGGLDVFCKADAIILECSFLNEFQKEMPTFGELVSILRDYDLHPIQFGVFDRTRGPIAYERNVLFVKSKYFSSVWNKED